MRIAENKKGQLRLYLITLVLIAGSLSLISCVTPGEPVIEETITDTETDPFSGEDPDIWGRDPLTGDLTWKPENVIFPGQREFLEVGSTELYDDLGLDISVEYNSSILPLWITTFFYLQNYYPENNLQDHFVSVLNDIYYAWGDNSEIIDAQELTFTYAGQTAVDGFYALVRYEQGPDDGDWGGDSGALSLRRLLLYEQNEFSGSRRP